MSSNVAKNPRTWVEISRIAMVSNVAALQALLEPTVSLCAFVKSFAYGHDISLTTKLLGESGVTHFGVDSLDEALAVRAVAPDAAIFIMGMVPAERFDEVVKHDCVQNIYDEEGLLAIIAAAVAKQKVALINIEIETGLNRLGVIERVLVDLLRTIKNNPRSVKLVGLSTHLSSAEDVAEQHYVYAQEDGLQRALELCASYELSVPFVHCANSAATIFAPRVHDTMVRVGIALYGLWPSAELRLAVQRGRAFELQPVLSWKTTVAQIKDVPAGGAIGYDRTFITNRAIRVAVLLVGYWDGYDRGLSNKGKVLIHGRPCAVLGRICMNMMMVDVSEIAQVKAGDIVTLLGREGIGMVTAETIAQELGTINYEVVTRINPLIPRLVV
ncbi:TPA: alanine racemase [Candidatus Uhrbacteria bacterium]|nr:alanine racemase [Candidatus Uhrbacteria bacterium]